MDVSSKTLAAAFLRNGFPGENAQPLEVANLCCRHDLCERLDFEGTPDIKSITEFREALASDELAFLSGFASFLAKPLGWLTGWLTGLTYWLSCSTA